MQKRANNYVTPIVSITREAWRSESPRPRRRSIIRDFALTTSTHGLPSIARSQSKHNCIFWSVSCVIFIGIMIFFVTQTIINYFQYPTQITVSIGVERSQTFPAVTFCNYSPGRFDHMIGLILNYTNSNNLTNTNDTMIYTADEVVFIEQLLREKLNAGESVDYYFFSLDVMLINCLYNNETCTADDFISFLSSMHGRCFTFNAKTKNVNGSSLRRTSDNGGPGKLQLRLYAQSHLYVPFISEDVSAGIVAMIHDNTELPRVDVASMELAPGRKHKLGYRKKTTYFLPSPYTDCTNKIPLAMQAMFDQYEGADYAYSQDICYLLCTQAYIYQQCGCVNPYEWSARSVVLPGTDTIIEAPLCSFLSTCYLDATVRLTNSTSLWNQFCSNCTQECSTVDFLITPSGVAAPSIPYAYIAKDFVESVSVPLPTNWTANWLSEVQNNYVSLDVVCESTLVENYTQQASISPVDVFSSVGGETGLWIGISFLSIMELVEMLYRLCHYEYQNIRRTLENKFFTNSN